MPISILAEGRTPIQFSSRQHTHSIRFRFQFKTKQKFRGVKNVEWLHIFSHLFTGKIDDHTRGGLPGRLAERKEIMFVQLLEVGCVGSVGGDGRVGRMAKKGRDARPGRRGERGHGRDGRRSIIGSSGCGQPLDFGLWQFLEKLSSSWEQLLKGRVVMMTSTSAATASSTSLRLSSSSATAAGRAAGCIGCSRVAGSIL